MCEGVQAEVQRAVGNPNRSPRFRASPSYVQMSCQRWIEATINDWGSIGLEISDSAVDAGFNKSTTVVTIEEAAGGQRCADGHR